MQPKKIVFSTRTEKTNDTAIVTLYSNSSGALNLYYCIYYTFLAQKRTSSFFYDYVGDEDSEPGDVAAIPEGHYEFDTNEEEPFWDPASREDELKRQLQTLTIPDISADSLL